MFIIYFMKQKYIKPFLLFLGPILAVILSIVTMVSLEMPIDVFYPNILGIALGVAIVVYLTPKWGDHHINSVYILSVVSLSIFISGFFFPGPRNVHRWISVGNIRLNIAMFLLPIVLYCLHQLLHEKKLLHGVLLFTSIMTILAIQPDAGQTSAFGLAALVVFFRNKIHIVYKLAALAIAMVAIFLVWNTVDLLEPIEYIDDIFYMIASLGPLGIAGMTLVSILLFSPFIYMSFKRIETVRTLSVAFIVYLSTSLIVTEFGHYPVPVFGAGASPVIGWFLMLSFVYRPH